MNNLILKIRALKPEKILIYGDSEGDPLVISTAGKTPQAIRATLEAENPVKVRLVTGEETLLTWSPRDLEEVTSEAPAPGTPDYDLFLRLMMRSQETVGKLYEGMMQNMNKQMEIVLSSQQKIIHTLDNKLNKLEERLDDTLDVRMARTLPDVEEEEKNPAPAPNSDPMEMKIGGFSVAQLVELVSNFMQKKEVKENDAE